MQIVACSPAPQFEARRSTTSTVTLGLETILAVDAPIQSSIEGVARLNDLLVSLDLVVTASSSTLAESLAETVVAEVTQDGEAAQVVLAPPSRGSIGGLLEMKIPPDMAVNAVQRGGPIDVLNVEGPIEIVASSHVRATGISNSVVLRIQTGNAIVSTSAMQGTTTDIAINTGDIEISLPRGLSVDVAAATGSGVVITNHPALPAVTGDPTNFSASVGGGLAIVRLSTGVGNIVLRVE